MSTVTLILPFIFLTVFLIVRMPIGFALTISAILELLATGNVSYFHQIPTVLYSAFDNFTLLAIPFFILAGEILSEGGIIDLVFKLVSAFLRRVPGGIGVISVVVSMMLSSMQGSSAATAAALGKVGTEGMKKEGYNEAFAASLIAASGGLAIMIPPSIAMIIYGTLSGTSIGKLFYGGVFPGILIGTALIGYIMIISKIRGYGTKNPEISKRNRFKLLYKSIPIILFPIIILSGFYTGTFTATEVAAISVVYAFFIGLFIYKTITPDGIYDVLKRSTQVTVSIFIIIAGAILFQHVLVLSGFIDLLTGIMRNSSLTKFEFLIIVSIILYFLGMFMEGVALNVLTTPIVVPIAISMGINPVYYGIILVLNIEIALISPPVGLNLFVLSGVTGIAPERMYKAVWPIILILLLCLIVIMLFPQITLFLPNVLMTK